MNVQKIAVILLLLLYSDLISAQEDPVGPDINNSYLTFNAFAAFGFENPRYTFGYVVPIHRRWMVGLDVGYANDKIIPGYYKNSIAIDNNYQLFEIRPRIYFKLKPSGKSQSYVSAEFFYTNHQDRFVNSTEFLKGKRFIQTENYVPISYDSATYLRQKTGVNFNAGFFLNLFEPIGINLDLGLGFRNRNIQYHNVENPMYFSPPESEAFVASFESYVIGNQGGANLTLNVKLFYKFEKTSYLFKPKKED